MFIVVDVVVVYCDVWFVFDGNGKMVFFLIVIGFWFDMVLMVFVVGIVGLI